MAEEFKVTLPKLGESILNATIVQWFKKVGDDIQLDEPLLEVSTDKVNSEIPSPVSGTLKAIHASVDQELTVGELLAVIAVGARSETPVSVAAIQASKEEVSGAADMKDFFSPALLRLAREKGIHLSELESLKGTGSGGRLTKQDLETYIESKMKGKPCPLAQPKAVVSATVQGEEIERMKMSGMRKAIADNMVRSFYEAPHATLVTEVDVTSVIKTVQQQKEEFQRRHGAKLTITSFVAHAIARAIQEFPLINSSLEGDTILVKRFVNLGIAVSIDQGLIVPVLKNCQRMTIVETAKGIQDLSTRARANKLTPADVTDGTISLTNFGMSGVQIGVPIIRFPEVAIVGVGAVTKKVVVLEDDAMAVRSMLHVSLTFDHRVLDGMYGCGFLGALKKHLEEDLKVD